VKPLSLELQAQFIDQCAFTKAQVQQLHAYGLLIEQWQKAINLVSPSTLPQLWERHLLDSAQLWPVLKTLQDNPVIVDLGSGGGLPGIVMAIAGATVTMVESDTRKCIFLRETARELGLKNVTVITQRIEKTTGVKAPLVTARALASLKQLIEWSKPLLQENGHMVFLKGEDAVSEIAELSPEYQGKARLIDSLTDPKAKIIIL
jgi:16S rRNA (guanine527-N7)-methyltransferase